MVDAAARLHPALQVRERALAQLSAAVAPQDDRANADADEVVVSVPDFERR